jgi:hypothetical protein
LFKPFKNTIPLGRLSAIAVLIGALFFQMGAVSVTSKACLTSGKEQIYFGGQRHCCAPEVVTQPTFQAQCCEIEQHSAFFNTFLPKDNTKELVVNQQDFAVLRAPRFTFVPDFIQRTIHIHRKIPPASGGDFLAIICRYII